KGLCLVRSYMRMFRLAVKRIEKIVVGAERVSDLLEARLRRRLAGLRQKSIEAFGAVSQVQHAKDRAQQDKPCQAGQERFPRWPTECRTAAFRPRLILYGPAIGLPAKSPRPR